MRVRPALMHRSLSRSSIKTEMRACMSPITEVLWSESVSGLHGQHEQRGFGAANVVPDEDRLSGFSEDKVLAGRVGGCIRCASCHARLSATEWKMQSTGTAHRAHVSLPSSCLRCFGVYSSTAVCSNLQQISTST